MDRMMQIAFSSDPILINLSEYKTKWQKSNYYSYKNFNIPKLKPTSNALSLNLWPNFEIKEKHFAKYSPSFLLKEHQLSWMPYCEAGVQECVRLLSECLLPVKSLLLDLFPPDEQSDLYFRFLVLSVSSITWLAVILMHVGRVPISLFSTSSCLLLGILWIVYTNQFTLFTSFWDTSNTPKDSVHRSDNFQSSRTIIQFLKRHLIVYIFYM